MKKLLSVFLIVAGLSLTFSCCKKDSNNNNNNNGGGGGGGNNTTTVPIGYSDTTSLTMQLDPQPFSLPINMKIDTFATKVDEFISPYGITKDKITKVNLKDLNMKLENTIQTFNFIKNMAPGVSAEILVDSFGGTAPKRVAYITDIAQNATTLNMNVDPVDIKDYFRAQYMEIWVKFNTQENEGVLTGTKFRFNFTFEVTLIP